MAVRLLLEYFIPYADVSISDKARHWFNTVCVCAISETLKQSAFQAWTDALNPKHQKLIVIKKPFITPVDPSARRSEKIVLTILVVLGAGFISFRKTLCKLRRQKVSDLDGFHAIILRNCGAVSSVNLPVSSVF